MLSTEKSSETKARKCITTGVNSFYCTMLSRIAPHPTPHATSHAALLSASRQSLEPVKPDKPGKPNKAGEPEESWHRVTGTYLDYAGPLDDASTQSRGCRYQVQRVSVPKNGDVMFPLKHSIYYPAESSARYLMTAKGPVRNRYVLRHFVLGYGNGGYVIGWYHERIMDMHINDMTVNDLKILSVDLKINMNLAALYARKPDGNFITGPVWLCALSSTGVGYCTPGPKTPQWDEKPQFVIHGSGWYVPSWVLPPNMLVQYCKIRLHRPHMLPEMGVVKKSPATRKRKSRANPSSGGTPVTHSTKKAKIIKS